MRNVELKAVLRDPAAVREVCNSLGAVYQEDIHQIDTYFHCPEGRLKLREADPGEDELVYYKRPDTAGPKGCDYLLEPVHRGVKPFLSQALGVAAVVDKVRSLYLWHNVRIHVDRVAGLGNFIEFEAVIVGEYNDEDGYRKLEQLTAAFGLTEADLLHQSYLDMSMARA